MALTIKNGWMLLIAILGLACQPEAKEGLNKTSLAELSEADKAQLEPIISEKLEKRDESGKVTEIEGLKKSDKLSDDPAQLASLDFREAVQNEESVFDFVPPEGLQAEFSEPVMVSGASLALSANSDDLAQLCEVREYFPEEPTFQDVLAQSQADGTCGDVSFSFCIRLSIPSKTFADAPNYDYTQSPDFQMQIPCSEESAK